MQNGFFRAVACSPQVHIADVGSNVDISYMDLWRIAAAKLIVAVVINVGLATFWLAQVYGEGYVVALPQRILKNVIMWPINTAVLYGMLKVFEGTGAFRAMGFFIPGRKKTEK